MNDPYPSSLTIEIDRKRLEKYLCFRAILLEWLPIFVMFGLIIGFGQAPDHVKHFRGSMANLLMFAAALTVAGGLLGAAIALILYTSFHHRYLVRRARTLEVSVNGAFLEIREEARGRSDRKLHFRSIVDYAITQDFMMRWFGIETLVMNTTGVVVTVPGVKDGLKVRDMLCEIDRIREVE